MNHLEFVTKKLQKKTIEIGLQLVKNHDHKIINYNNMHTHIYI